MFRRATNCEVYSQAVRIPLTKRMFGSPVPTVKVMLVVGKTRYAAGEHPREDWLKILDQAYPYRIRKAGSRTYWMVDRQIWWDDENLEAEDVHALYANRKRANERRLERAKANVARGFDNDSPTRKTISDEVMQFVFLRDGAQCVQCGSRSDLQYDHIIPFALGGSSEPENLQVLCASCNRKKGSNISQV